MYTYRVEDGDEFIEVISRHGKGDELEIELAGDINIEEDIRSESKLVIKRYDKLEDYINFTVSGVVVEVYSMVFEQDDIRLPNLGVDFSECDLIRSEVEVRSTEYVSMWGCKLIDSKVGAFGVYSVYMNIAGEGTSMLYVRECDLSHLSLDNMVSEISNTELTLSAKESSIHVANVSMGNVSSLYGLENVVDSFIQMYNVGMRQGGTLVMRSVGSVIMVNSRLDGVEIVEDAEFSEFIIGLYGMSSKVVLMGGKCSNVGFRIEESTGDSSIVAVQGWSEVDCAYVRVNGSGTLDVSSVDVDLDHSRLVLSGCNLVVSKNVESEGGLVLCPDSGCEVEYVGEVIGVKEGVVGKSLFDMLEYPKGESRRPKLVHGDPIPNGDGWYWGYWEPGQPTLIVSYESDEGDIYIVLGDKRCRLLYGESNVCVVTEEGVKSLKLVDDGMDGVYVVTPNGVLRVDMEVL